MRPNDEAKRQLKLLLQRFESAVMANYESPGNDTWVAMQRARMAIEDLFEQRLGPVK